MGRLAKRRDVQLVFQAAYCALALIACIGSVGFFDMKFTSDFYIYFTNVCLYLCSGIMVKELIQTFRKNKDDYVTAVPRLRFISMLGFVVTLIIFNVLLANDPGRDPALNFKVECILCHNVLPVLYVIDWVLFYKHGTVDRKLPLQAALLPLGYLLYVIIHAAIRGFDSSIMNYAGTDPIIYPYFFLNPERLGPAEMAGWILGLFVFFNVLGFVFMGIDRMLGKAIEQ